MEELTHNLFQGYVSPPLCKSFEELLKEIQNLNGNCILLQGLHVNCITEIDDLASLFLFKPNLEFSSVAKQLLIQRKINIPAARDLARTIQRGEGMGNLTTTLPIPLNRPSL